MALVLSTIGEVSAQDIETLVMPGELIIGHAKFEPECSLCHKKFDRDAQRQLCLDCHEDVAADVVRQNGFHGLSNDVGESACSSCHSEHNGRDAIIVALDESAFNHDFTDFELIGAHLEVECSDCHSADTKYRDAGSACNDCHSEDDVHKELLGTDCAECHQISEWSEATFDHDTTGYPLLGNHKQTACLDCHEDETYQNAPTTCFGCHANDDAHDGRSGTKCENCHNPSDWNDAKFDHARNTDFPLRGKHASLTCDDCHTDDPFKDEMDRACASCHIEDDSHNRHNGDQCNDCHSNDSWDEQLFDHNNDTDYELRGGHREVACVDCHVEPIFEAALVTDCDSCHLDDDAHDGTLGIQCASCHTEINWQDPVFFDHDLTAFPLLGKHSGNECEDCHQSQAFKNTESDCSSCHAADNPHNGSFPDRCDTCHNPVAWDRWVFDHDLQTDFPLAGAHQKVACGDCHRTPIKKMHAIGATCQNCHRADDVHDGEFGFDCGRCHSVDSFSDVRSLQ